MDRKIENGKRNKRKKQGLIGVGIALALLAGIFLFSSSGGKYRVKESRLRVEAVKQGIFEDVINVQASIEPEQSFLIDAVEGGTVQEKFEEAGAFVTKGDPLLRLTNTNLMLDFMNRETQIVEQINNLRNTRMQMELNDRDIRQQVLDIALEKQLVARQFTIDTNLYASAVIARQEYEESRDRYQYLVKKEKLLRDGFEQNHQYQKTQLKQIDLSIAMMERNLNAIRENLENLTVKAPISGQLTSLNVQIGESKVVGENLGRIDVLDSFIVRATIDEHYLSRVRAGQQAFFAQAGQNFGLFVSKVLPEVSNNQFTVEFAFVDTIPNDIRRGQSVSVKLSLSNSVQAVMVPRGAFYSSSGGKWVFVLNENETEATKRPVELGRQNPDFIEVKSGLEPGEKVITSAYTGFENYESILLEKEN